MTEFKSHPALVSVSTEKLYDYLTNLERFRESLPEQVTNYRTDGDSCSFTIQGMADISLTITEKIPYETVVFNNSLEKPFPFSLHFDIAHTGTDACRVTVAFRGELNPMLAMIAKGPLQNFVNLVAEKLGRAKI